MSEKIWAICGGSDWFDASVEHVILPEGLDIQAAHKRWNDWYAKEYRPRTRSGENPKYMNFHQWLLSREGARQPSAKELGTFWA